MIPEIPETELDTLQIAQEEAQLLASEGRILDGYHALDLALAAVEADADAPWAELLIERYRQVLVEYSRLRQVSWNVSALPGAGAVPLHERDYLWITLAEAEEAADAGEVDAGRERLEWGLYRVEQLNVTDPWAATLAEQWRSALALYHRLYAGGGIEAREERVRAWEALREVFPWTAAPRQTRSHSVALRQQAREACRKARTSRARAALERGRALSQSPPP